VPPARALSAEEQDALDRQIVIYEVGGRREGWLQVPNHFEEDPHDAARTESSPQDTEGTFVTPGGQLVVVCEGGWGATRVDVRELVAWLRAHRPDLLA
jgi:hypothetical protein